MLETTTTAVTCVPTELPTERTTALKPVEDEIDEGRLTAWMHEHLRVVAVPVANPDALDGLETEVLRRLDPPLNLDKMPKSLVRGHLTQLRRRYSRKARPKSL